MEKISVLISGKDVVYIQSLAFSLSEENKDMYVTCYSPERIVSEISAENSKFDVFMLEEGLIEHNNFQKNKVILLSDKVASINENHTDECRVFKYQSIKNISAVIYGCYMNNSLNRKTGAGIKIIKDLSSRGLINIGITGKDTDLYGEIGLMLARSLSAAGKDVICFDLQEFYEMRDNRIVKIGNRSWDDFIYCCVYGRTRDIMKNPKKYASADEWGVLFFEGKEGKNPFSQLDTEERDLFFSRIKNEFQQDFAISILPESGNSDLMMMLSEYDLIIIVNYGNKADIHSGINLRRTIESKNDNKVKVITLCYGGKWESGDYSDFNVRFTNNVLGMNMKEIMCTETWNDIVRIAGYIGDGCFE